LSSNDDQVIYSDDYTKLFTYQSRQFTAGDISLRAINGVQWNAALPAAVVGGAATIIIALMLWVLGLSPWWSALVVPVSTLAVYVRMAKDRAGGLTETEKLRLAWNYRYRQPREVLGLGEDTEPTDFAWDVILWEPPTRAVNPGARR
jgi:uncharacterized membrane protein